MAGVVVVVVVVVVAANICAISGWVANISAKIHWRNCGCVSLLADCRGKSPMLSVCCRAQL